MRVDLPTGAVTFLFTNVRRVDAAAALPMLKEAGRINRDLGMPAAQTAMHLHRFARGLAFAGQVAAAARKFACAEAQYEETGAHARPLTGAMDEKTLSSIRQLEDAEFAEAWEQGQALTPDEVVALALDSEPDA